MDFFSEHIVKKKKTNLDKLKIAGIFIGGFILIYLVLLFAQFMRGYFLLLIAGILYLMYLELSSINIEYEYSVTNGDLDIDKIIAKRKRKKIISVNSKDFEYFAPLTSDYKSESESQSIAKKYDLCSDLNSDKNYFIIVFINGQKCRIVFEPTEKMIEDFAHFVKRSVFFRK